MPRYQILIDESFHRPVDEVFAKLADHNQMGKLFGAPVKRIRDGQQELNGVGSVRHIGPPGPLGVQETVTAFEPARRIEYRVTKGGAPMKNHRGQMRFDATAQGSRLQWQIDFDMPPIIGGIVSKVLKGALVKGVRTLA